MIAKAISSSLLLIFLISVITVSSHPPSARQLKKVSIIHLYQWTRTSGLVALKFGKSRLLSKSIYFLNKTG